MYLSYYGGLIKTFLFLTSNAYTVTVNYVFELLWWLNQNVLFLTSNAYTVTVNYVFELLWWLNQNVFRCSM